MFEHREGAFSNIVEEHSSNIVKEHFANIVEEHSSNIVKDHLSNNVKEHSSAIQAPRFEIRLLKRSLAKC